MQNLHPALIHFPIVLLIAGFVLDVLSTVLKKDSLRVSGWWCLLVGGLSLTAAIASGIYAANTAGHNDVSHTIMDRHKQVAYMAAALFGLLLVWRGLKRTMLPETVIQLTMYYAIGVFAVGTMIYGAHLGGRLVYEYGVGVVAVPQAESGGHEHNHGDGSDHHTATPNPGAGTVIEADQTSASPARPPSETHVHSDGSAHTH
jgi:uncharacterized membrane protein